MRLFAVIWLTLIGIVVLILAMIWAYSHTPIAFWVVILLLITALVAWRIKTAIE